MTTEDYVVPAWRGTCGLQPDPPNRPLTPTQVVEPGVGGERNERDGCCRAPVLGVLYVCLACTMVDAVLVMCFHRCQVARAGVVKPSHVPALWSCWTRRRLLDLRYGVRSTLIGKAT